MNPFPARLLFGALSFLGLALALAVVAALGAFDSARADTSGTNASGYVWIDSNPPDPTVPFEWIDATGGTLITSTDCDDCADTVMLPFTFSFFGTDYTEIAIGTNGLLSFNTADPDGCNDNYNWSDTYGTGLGNPIPYTDVGCDVFPDNGWGANPLIAPWFDDLDPGECGDVYYNTFGTAPDRTFVIEFNDVCHNDCFDCAAGEGVTFEIILFETSNDIKFQYMDTFFGTGSADISEENAGGTATTGLDLDATVGLGYHWGGADGGVLTDNLAVLFSQGVDLAVTKTASTTTPTVGDEVTFTIEVMNAGVTDATNVVITDDLPAGLTYVSSTASQGSCSEAGGTVTCNLGNIAAGGTATVEIVVQVTAEGAISNTAAVSADQTNVDANGGTATAALNAGAAPTPTPSPSPAPTATPGGLPDTGSQPGGESGLPSLLIIAAGLAATAAGGFWLLRRATVRA